MSEITVTMDQIGALADKLATLSLDDTERTLLLAIVSAGVQSLTDAEVEGFLLPAVRSAAPGAQVANLSFPGGASVLCDGSVMPSPQFGAQLRGVFGSL